MCATETPCSDVRERNRRLNSEEYAARSLTLESFPTCLFVELTQNCNLHCNMCRAATRYSSTLDMDDNLFEKIVSDLAPFASMVDLRGWGESTILSSFERKLLVVAATGARIRLVTNGLAMKPAYWDPIWRSDGSVAVSLDAATPALFSQLGRGDLSRVIQNVRVGVEHRHRVGHGDLYFIMVISSFNAHEIPAVVTLAASLGVPRVVLKPVKTWPGHLAETENIAAGLPAWLDAGATIARNSNVALQIAAALHESQAITDRLPTTCTTPWSHCVISHDGSVRFCDHLLTGSDSRLGDLATASFREIWNGPAYVDLRRAHVAAERSRSTPARFGRCTWCYSNRYRAPDSAPIPTEEPREVSTATVATLYRGVVDGQCLVK